MTKSRLPLLAPGEELAGAGPAAFERLARTTSSGAEAHRRVLAGVTELVRETVRSSVPPSSAPVLLDALDGLTAWCTDPQSLAPVRLARQSAFAALGLLEKATVSAVQKAAALSPIDESPLAKHAQQVVLRYASLAAHFATSAVCHSLDAVETPEALLEVPRDIVGGHAYRTAGLGSARNPEFWQRAHEQAEWEASRPASRELGHDAEALAPQIFHEYLGARWRALAAAERSRVDAELSRLLADA